jgi:glutathione S-transferase
MLKIIGKASSINVRKVLWTCAELALPFERQDWEPGHASLNPNAMVPVLIDGDFVMWESNAICRYLASRYPQAGLLGTDTRQRARIEQWMDWQATELNNSWRYAFMALVRQSPAHLDAALVQASIDGWNRHIGILDAQLRAAGPFATGSRFTLADVVLGLSVNRWALTPMERPDYPALQAYYDRLAERPGFRQYGRNGTP